MALKRGTTTGIEISSLPRLRIPRLLAGWEEYAVIREVVLFRGILLILPVKAPLKHGIHIHILLKNTYKQICFLKSTAIPRKRILHLQDIDIKKITAVDKTMRRRLVISCREELNVAIKLFLFLRLFFSTCPHASLIPVSASGQQFRESFSIDTPNHGAEELRPHFCG